MKSTASKGFWFAIAILAAFGIARIVLDVRAQHKAAGNETASAPESSESASDSGSDLRLNRSPKTSWGKRLPIFSSSRSADSR